MGLTGFRVVGARRKQPEILASRWSRSYKPRISHGSMALKSRPVATGTQVNFLRLVLLTRFRRNQPEN